MRRHGVVARVKLHVLRHLLAQLELTEHNDGRGN